MAVITVAPAGEPVSTADLKAHLRVETTSEDTLIASLGVAAREWVEAVCGLQIVEATVREDFTGFPAEFRLARHPVQSVSSITYTDTAGAQQTWAASNYQADLDVVPALIMPAYGVSYPAARMEYQSISVTYVAGWASGGDPVDYGYNVPGPIKTAIKQLVAHWYEHRMAAAPQQMHAAPMSVQMLLAPYRLWQAAA